MLRSGKFYPIAYNEFTIRSNCITRSSGMPSPFSGPETSRACGRQKQRNKGEVKAGRDAFDTEATAPPIGPTRVAGGPARVIKIKWPPFARMLHRVAKVRSIRYTSVTTPFFTTCAAAAPSRRVSDSQRDRRQTVIQTAQLKVPRHAC
eukprot:207145-Prorocentrum_minimum.AAC.1